MSTPTTKVFSVTCNIFSFCVYFKEGTSFVVFCRKLYNLHSVFYQEVPYLFKSHFTSFSLIFVHYRNACVLLWFSLKLNYNTKGFFHLSLCLLYVVIYFIQQPKKIIHKTKT